jgi:phosphoenolpyruvate carboxylase
VVVDMDVADEHSGDMTDLNGGQPGSNGGSLSRDVRLLASMLGKIIREQEGETAFELVEGVRRLAKARRAGDPDAARQLEDKIAALDLASMQVLIKAFSNYFQLINIAEDQQRVRVLRQREIDGRLDESIDDAVGALRAAGLDAPAVEALLQHLRVRLVLTAHPSEAKRKEILLKLREVTDMMDTSDRCHLTPREQRALYGRLREEIEEMWQTRAIRTLQKKVSDEVDFGLYFLTTTIMDVVIDIYDELEASLNQHYPDYDWSARWWKPPAVLRFGSWIGGDRDGNPRVTDEVTLETLASMRAAARQVYLDEVALLRDHLTQSIDETSISSELRQAVESASARDEHRYPGEYYRQHMEIIRQRLEADTYPTNNELLDDLLLVDASLRQHRGLHVARGSLQRLIRKVRLFGLHLVPLDIREDARLQAQALDELFRFYGIAQQYLKMPEKDKQDLLTDEIKNPRPFFPKEHDIRAFSETTQRVINTWRMIDRAHRQYGKFVIDCVIASMCQQPSDVLAMLLLAAEVGVQDSVDLVPLFETIDDLYRGSEIVRVLFENEPYRRHMEARGERHGLHQQIMIGYSDSSKDGGYLASNWNLYLAQQRLLDVCTQYGVSLQLFHGRGGSIGRGGGPTNRAVRAQPPLSLKGGIKITEQGEVIAYRYGNPYIARRHLNQVMHAALVMLGTLPEAEVRPAWEEAMNTLSESGRKIYRQLVYETEGFLDYWNQATPISELGRLPISSRPAKRSQGGGFESIRAIPWVFSWMQSRAILPSWYGVGSALAAYCEDQPQGIDLLREMYHQWPFFNALIENVQLDVAKADMGIAGIYAALVEDEAVREAIFGAIRDEHRRTREYLCLVLEKDDLLENAPVIKRSIERRNPYVDPLNFIQVALLRQLRQYEPDTPEYDRLLTPVLATVNGIAAGMKTTG